MSKIYKAIITVSDRFVPTALRPLWEHPAGPKTIFFWAPAFKWVKEVYKSSTVRLAYFSTLMVMLKRNFSFSMSLEEKLYSRKKLVVKEQALVMASLDEYRRPLEKVSTTQSGTLAATGLIWTRYCLIITPINYSLSLCNFLLGMANGVQCFRAYRFQENTKNNN